MYHLQDPGLIFPRTREGTFVYKSSFRICLLVILLMSSCFASAAGLGKLTLSSALGQPLKAEIDLVAVNNENISSISAQLASETAFRQAGIDYKSFFPTLNLSIKPRSNGDLFVEITSPQVINEPFLNILVELSWASGRLMREYTALLDPIDTVIPETSIAEIEPVVIHTEVPNVSTTQIDGQIDVQAISSELRLIQHGSNTNTYGPVAPGDTLSSIAQKTMLQGVSINQMLVALHQANPNAFIGNNINLLKVGAILRIPDDSEMASISTEEANSKVKVQIADWRTYQDDVATASSEIITDEILTNVDQTTNLIEEDLAKESPNEVLRLSSGAQEDATFDSLDARNNGALERLRMVEEDSVARSLALDEAHQRITILERNIQNLQKLLELKDPTLAQAQLHAESILEPVIETEAEHTTITAVPDLQESEPELTVTDEQKSEIQPQPIITEPIVLPEQPLPVEEATLMDQLMANIAYIGGALIALLLGILAFIKIRRKKSENESDDEESLDPTSFQTKAALASIAGAGAADASQETDDIQPITDDDIADYDTEVLNDNTAEEGLYDIDSDNSFDKDIDETIDSSETNAPGDSDLYAPDNLAEQSPESGSDFEFDLGLDEPVKNETEDNAQLNEISVDSPIEDTNPLAGIDLNIEDDATEQPIEDDITELPDDTEQSVVTPIEEDYDIDLNIKDALDDQGSEDSTESTVANDTEPDELDNSIEFDTDALINNDLSSPNLLDEPVSLEQDVAPELSIDFPEESDDNEQSETEQPAAEPDLDLDLGLDLDSEDKLEPFMSDSNTGTSQQDDTVDPTLADDDALLPEEPNLADTDLEMDDLIPAIDDLTPTVDDQPEAEEDDTHNQEAETKIDLAKAYLEMEDREGAKEILEEVLQEGNTQQKQKAEEILADL